jgi:hypothetical protein
MSGLVINKLRKTPMKNKTFYFVILLAITLFGGLTVLAQTISVIDTTYKALPTNQFGAGYGTSGGIMEDLKYPSCGTNCINRFIAAYATASASSIVNGLSTYHEKVRVEFRVLDPWDQYN